jgi:4a-hydroxytetrahydrobiopterin dehydratase
MPNHAIAPVKQALSATQIIAKLSHLNRWNLFGDGAEVAIEKTFSFDSHLQVMAFANAVAFVAQRQDHHPEMLLNFNTCSIRFRTHDVMGISTRDFEAASQVDALLSHE